MWKASARIQDCGFYHPKANSPPHNMVTSAASMTMTTGPNAASGEACESEGFLGISVLVVVIVTTIMVGSDLPVTLIA